MFDKFKLSKKLREEYDYLMEVNNIQKSIKSDLKTYYKINKDKEYSNELKKALISLVESPRDINTMVSLDHNMGELIRNLPTKTVNFIKQDMFLDVLNILKERIDNDVAKNLLCEKIYYTDYNIFDFFSTLSKNDISVLNEDNRNNFILFLKNENDKLKISTIIVLFNLAFIIKNNNIVSYVFSIIPKLNEKKLGVLFELLNIIDYSTVEVSDSIIRILIEFIEKYDFDDKLYNNYSSLVKILFDKDLSKIKDNSINKILNYMKTGNQNNINLLLSVLSNDLFLKKDKKFQDIVFDVVMRLEIDNDNKYLLLNTILNDFIMKSESTYIRDYLLDKLLFINSIYSLQMLVDIYPFLSKYSNDDSIINAIDSVPLDKSQSKKLTILLEKK